MHRAAYQNLFYDSQCYPKSIRSYKFLIYECMQREILEERLKKGTRTNKHYRGKPTKYLLRLVKLERKIYDNL